MFEEQEPVSERIKMLFEHFGKGNLSAFARELNVSAQAIRDLIKGKKGGPSWPVVQNILRAFPDVNTDWLVLGRGLMLREEYFDANPSVEVEDILSEVQARNMLQYAMEKAGGFDSFMDAFFESMKPGLSDKIKKHYASLDGFQNENAVYRVDGEGFTSLPYEGLLTRRLGISSNEALALIKQGRIKYISMDGTDKASSLLVPERAVRDFLNEAYN